VHLVPVTGVEQQSADSLVWTVKRFDVGTDAHVRTLAVAIGAAQLIRPISGGPVVPRYVVVRRREYAATKLVERKAPQFS
jgi:hypothetical protein